MSLPKPRDRLKAAGMVLSVGPGMADKGTGTAATEDAAHRRADEPCSRRCQPDQISTPPNARKGDSRDALGFWAINRLRKTLPFTPVRGSSRECRFRRHSRVGHPNFGWSRQVTRVV